MRRSQRRILIALALLAGVSNASHAQAGVVTIRGRVVLSTDTPASGATVSVSTFDAGETQVDVTGPDGRYRVVMRSTSRSFYVTVRAAGFAPRTRRVTASPTDTAVGVPDVRLMRSTQALPTIRVVAPRSPPVRAGARFGGKPGEDEQTVDASSAFTTTLTGDPTGDLESALTAVPGIAVTSSASGGSQVAIGGLDATENRITLNGADATPTPPRDGGVLRVAMSSYDPAVAMSGVRTQWEMLGGNYRTSRTLRLTFDPFVVHGDASPITASARANAPILSGSFAGPVRHLARFHNTAFQISRRATSTPTLVALDDASLATIGVVPDSLHRLLASLEGLGLGAASKTAHASQNVLKASVYSRLDFTKESPGSILTTPAGQIGTISDLGDGRIFYVIVGGDGSTSRYGGAGSLALASQGVTSSRQHFLIQAFHSIYARRYVLNETRLSANIGRGSSRPLSPLPAAAIFTSSADANGAGGILAFHAGGIGDASRTDRSWSLQLMNETRWPSRGGSHEWKVAFESMLDGESVRSSASRGRFDFASITDFIASRPASFSRSLSAASTSVRGVHLGLGVGDSYTPSRSLAWQFGVRAEAHGLVAGNPSNRAADSLFGVQTGVLPMRVSVAPMAGFTWKYRRNRAGYPSNDHTLRGGIRDYRYSVPTRSAASFLGGVFGQASQQLRCVGAAAPAPDWERYAASEATIPTTCGQASPDSLLAQRAFPVALFAPAFAMGHAVRADLQWSTRIANALSVSLHGRTALNTNQPSLVDLNFNGVSRFRVDDERGRPVFVTPASISDVSGAASTLESRRFSQFSYVNERRTDLHSRATSLTATLNVRPAMSRFGSGVKVPLTIAYTWFDTREQRNGFSGTTSGDPRVVEWQPSVAGRHAVVLSTALHVPDWFRLIAGVQWRSGIHYTPTVLGDVNADGLSANDRAFVFDPAQTSDTALRSAFTALLTTGAAGARRCLGAQRSVVARPNSCVGPSTATMNAVVIVDAARIGLQNRGALQIHVNNLFAGIDQLVHGAGRLHGWGQPVYSDPVLLRVNGFDPASHRFRYDVNRSFGDSRPFERIFYAPFRVTLELVLNVGPDREQVELAARLASGTREHFASADSGYFAERLRLAHDRRNLFEPVLRRADEYQLTQPQRDSLEQLGRSHGKYRDSVYGALAGVVAAHHGALKDEEVRDAWRNSMRAVARFEWHTGEMARRVLTPAQAEQVFGRNGPLGARPIIFDAEELERELKLWQERVF